ncbi:MAG TPA: MHYT domain-containing protein [Thermohalobaculum sp.]|nr:MHYT domain-containing protein [Thermohalobaculum sp.]
MLVVTYDPLLVTAAVLVAVMASFTGLRLASGLSPLDHVQRKSQISMAAVALGGGIWSTHFVAMLALRLPVPVFYDALTTLASALIAILLAGGALLLLHFGARTASRVAAAGVLMGTGIVAMHYTGMAGIEGCGTVFAAPGYLVSTALAIALSIAALRLAYGRRTLGTLVLGGAAYGAGIVAMHFSAMYWTSFIRLEAQALTAPVISNDYLALIVTLATFVLCSAFLLTLATAQSAETDARPAVVPPAPAPVPPAKPAQAATGAARRTARVPYERDGKTFFVAASDILAARADGHYTTLFRGDEELFCPWPISRLEEELEAGRFLRTHRSYLVNLDFVRGFERRKDQGVCLFDVDAALNEAPVSRANLAQTRALLGL